MKFDIDACREIIDTITRNKSRSILTGFGVFWGIFMLIVLIGGGQGLKELLQQNFAGFATNTAVIWSQPTTKPYKGFRKGRMWQMDLKDIDRLHHQVPELDVVTPLVFSGRRSVVAGDKSYQASVQGVRPDYARVSAPQMFYGRSITIVSLSLSAKTIPDFTIEVAKAHDYYFKLKFKKISATEVSLIGIEQWELWIDDYELTIEEKYKDPDYGDEYTVTMVGDMGNNRNDYTAEKADSYDYPGFSIYEVAHDTQNRQLTKLVLPSTVSIIFHNAFSGMKSLQKIDLGDNVAHIGQRVFSECKALKSIIFPDKVTKLFDFVCEGCADLESITIGSGMQKIISLSFTDCKNLKTITALPTTPPSINLDSYYVFPKDISAKVIVPIESKSAYEKDWGTIYPKMTFEEQTTSSVKNINDDVSSNIKVLGRTLNIYGSNIAIYNSQAQLVAKACGVYTSTLPAGVYIVVIDGKTQKIIIR